MLIQFRTHSVFESNWSAGNCTWLLQTCVELGKTNSCWHSSLCTLSSIQLFCLLWIVTGRRLFSRPVLVCLATLLVASTTPLGVNIRLWSVSLATPAEKNVTLVTFDVQSYRGSGGRIAFKSLKTTGCVPTGKPSICKWQNCWEILNSMICTVYHPEILWLRILRHGTQGGCYSLLNTISRHN